MNKPCDVYCVSCCATDIGTQRCRLSEQLFNLLSLNNLDYVKICIKDFSAICRVFQCSGSNDRLEIDGTVCTPGKTIANMFFRKVTARITQLKVSEAKSIDIVVVVKTLHAGKHDNIIISSCIRELMHGYCVQAGYCFDSKNITAVGIEKILVLSTKSKTAATIVGKATDINIVRFISEEKFKQLYSTTKISPLGGVEQYLKTLHEALLPVLFPKSFSSLGMPAKCGVLLTGPAGTGKTAIVFKLTEEHDIDLVYIPCAELAKPQPGESERTLKNIFSNARSRTEEGPCILFFDDIDLIGQKRTASLRADNNRTLTQLLTLLDGVETYQQIACVATTNRPNDLDPALRRPGRLDREVLIGIPSLHQREDILKVITKQLPLDQNVSLSQVADCTPGFTGADLSLLCRQVVLKYLRAGIMETIKQDLIMETLLEFRPTYHRGNNWIVNDIKKVDWNNIGGLEDVKTKLRWLVELPLLKPDLWLKFGLPQPKGALLFGPPGCCKTTLVKALASSVNATFLSASPAQIYSPYVGDSEKAVMEVFKRARSCSPCILFFDELDSMVGKRDDAHQKRGVHEKILSVLLNEMDGIGIKMDEKQRHNNELPLAEMTEGVTNSEVTSRESGTVNNFGVFVIAATNRPDLIDRALIRRGRIDSLIYVPSPDLESRKDILSSITKKIPVNNVDFGVIAEKTSYFSGADLENLCREAAMCAIRQRGVNVEQIELEHFEMALKYLRPSLTEKTITFYERLNLL